MNTIKLMHKIQEYADSNRMVGSTSLGDLYENLNTKMDIAYSRINIDVASVQREENQVVYSVFLYYVDRLLEDKKNWLEIKSAAEDVLHTIINYANRLGEVQDNYTITFFEEQFADYCAGAWVNFNIEFPIEIGDCTFENMETEEYDDDPLIEKLKEIIRQYQRENAELALLLNEILYKLTGETV